MDKPPPIHGLHHAAFRCSDSGRTHDFYQGLLGLPLVDAFEIRATKTGRATEVLHSFYALGDGSCLAFFEAPDLPFDFKDQHDFDLHIALRVDRPALDAIRARAEAAGVEVRGISDHGFIESIYLRDPDGYVVELTAPTGTAATAPGAARRALVHWQARRGR
jgi:catechol 2,3-dioxygenase-like lactoylglutathione lyase family enzyme